MQQQWKFSDKSDVATMKTPAYLQLLQLAETEHFCWPARIHEKTFRM